MAIHDLEINLDLKQNLNVYANCKQLDTLHLILNIFDDGVQADLSNYNVRLMAMKPDNIPFIQDTDYTVVNNVVTIIAHEQLTTTSGVIKIELQFINKITGEKKATFNLNLKVIASTLEIERSISAATYTLLEELENKLDQAVVISENIDEAIEINKTLSTATTNATDMKNILEIDIEKGNVINTDLTKNISDGNITNTTLENIITTGNQLKTDIDAKNEQAESNIKAMESFEDVTKLTQIVADHTTQLSDITQDIAQLSNPNLLINGDFQVWQRGTSFNYVGATLANIYTADRWRMIQNSGNGSCTIAQMKDDGHYLALNNFSKPSGIEMALQQVLEDLTLLKNKTYTLSFEYKSTVAIATKVLSSSTQISYKDLNSATSWTKATMSFNSGNYNTGIGICIDFPSSLTYSNASMCFRNVKLEIGDGATPFIPRLYAEELALCQRYYQKLKISGIAYSSLLLPLWTNYPITMRKPPSIKVYNSVTENSLDKFGIGAVDITGFIPILYDNSQIGYIQHNSNIFVTGQLYDGMAYLDAEIY